MECPKCQQTLHATAKYCGCGWKYSYAQTPAPAVNCAYANCQTPAMCRIKTKTGWANFCDYHYNRHFTDQAHANLDKYGLERLADETQHEHTARLRQAFRTGLAKFNAKTKAHQEPDWESPEHQALLRDFSTDEGMQP